MRVNLHQHAREVEGKELLLAPRGALKWNPDPDPEPLARHQAMKSARTVTPP